MKMFRLLPAHGDAGVIAPNAFPTFRRELVGEDIAIDIVRHQGAGDVLGVSDIALEIGHHRDPFYAGNAGDSMRHGDGQGAVAETTDSPDPIRGGARLHLVQGIVQSDHKAEQSEGRRHRQEGDQGSDGLAPQGCPDEREIFHQIP